MTAEIKKEINSRVIFLKDGGQETIEGYEVVFDLCRSKHNGESGWFICTRPAYNAEEMGIAGHLRSVVLSLTSHQRISADTGEFICAYEKLNDAIWIMLVGSDHLTFDNLAGSKLMDTGIKDSEESEPIELDPDLDEEKDDIFDPDYDDEDEDEDDEDDEEDDDEED
jgi:hypothetical protein